MWSGGGYTYTTLSDLSNTASYESCDLGCNQGKKYRCKDGYDYDSSTKKCIKAKTCEDYTSGQNIYVTPGPSVNPSKQCTDLTLPSGKQYGFDNAYPAGNSMRCLKCAVKDSGSGGSSNSCTASSYTASVTCSLSYSTDECCSAFGCSGNGCGTGYYKCKFDIPSCAFSSVSIHATDSVGQDHVVVQAGAGTSEQTVNNYKIPGPGTPCEFFASGSSLGKVAGEAVSGQAYTWRCSYTRKIR